MLFFAVDVWRGCVCVCVCVYSSHTHTHTNSVCLFFHLRVRPGSLSLLPLCPPPSPCTAASSHHISLLTCWKQQLMSENQERRVKHDTWRLHMRVQQVKAGMFSISFLFLYLLGAGGRLRHQHISEEIAAGSLPSSAHCSKKGHKRVIWSLVEVALCVCFPEHSLSLSPPLLSFL